MSHYSTSFMHPALDVGWNFNNSYIEKLPQTFYKRQKPVPVTSPKLIVFNQALAESLGLSPSYLDSPQGAAIFGGSELPPGSDSVAQAYAGHQFGHFTMLGDGRAVLLGEQLTPSGERFDIALKGSGQTPFSRRGDGRATLGPMLREYIISEAMHALGIPTTRSLAVVATGETVYRETALPGAVLTRIAASHIRVGTFEYASAWGSNDDLSTLARYILERHYPERAEADNPALALLRGVIERQAALIAKWQMVGFIHGVMNTDNMTLSGETIDYGPCAFMDTYDPATVFSSIDRQGRYAYANQPPIAQWNLARLTEALLPILHQNSQEALELGQEAISTFQTIYHQAWLSGMRAKLGLFNEEANDFALIDDLLQWMGQNQKDFTLTFRELSAIGQAQALTEAGFQEWLDRWKARLSRQNESTEDAAELMRQNNPAVIPRNYRVEEALDAAVEQSDLSVLHRLLAVLATPYEDNLTHSEICLPPAPGGLAYQTFCGT